MIMSSEWALKCRDHALQIHSGLLAGLYSIFRPDTKDIKEASELEKCQVAHFNNLIPKSHSNGSQK